MSLCCTDVSKKIVFPLSALTLAIFSSTALADTWTCEQLDKLNTRSAQVVSPPSTCESLIGDIGGFRSALADRGWGVQLSWNPMVMYDLKGQSGDPQQYAGQNFTWSQNMSLNVTYDLSRIGFSKDAQFTFSPQWATSNYHDSYPELHNIAVLAVNQPLLNGQLELQYGFYPLIRQFYGMVLGELLLSRAGADQRDPGAGGDQPQRADADLHRHRPRQR